MIDKNNLKFTEINKEPFDPYLCTGLYNNFNVEWEKAENEYLYVKGLDKKVIDFTSGILVNCLGYKNQVLSNEIKKLLDNGILHSYHYQTSIKKEYLKSLFTFTSDIIDNPKLYLTSSGTEATESCMKIMLRHGKKNSPFKNKILSIEGNYHGRTMGAAFMGYGGIFSEIWPTIDNSFPKIKFPYLWKITEEKGGDFFHEEIKKLDPEILNFSVHDSDTSKEPSHKLYHSL